MDPFWVGVLLGLLGTLAIVIVVVCVGATADAAFEKSIANVGVAKEAQRMEESVRRMLTSMPLPCDPWDPDYKVTAALTRLKERLRTTNKALEEFLKAEQRE